jgi:hypothetical protein
MLRAKRRRKRVDEFAQYVIAVSGSEHTYGLRVSGGSRLDIGLYGEMATLALTGGRDPARRLPVT